MIEQKAFTITENDKIFSQGIIDLINRGEGLEAVYKLAIYFLENYFIITPSDTEEVFIYNNGIYYPFGKEILCIKIEGMLGKYSSTSIVNEVLNRIKRRTLRNRRYLVEPKDKICLANGVLNIKDLIFVPHNPNLVFFNKIPVSYNPSLDCIKIKKFLSEVVSEQDKKILQELVGYCLYKDYSIQKAFILLGKGSNGKSTFLKLLERFLGASNVSSVSLQMLESNRFASSALFGKLANIFADLSSKALSSTTTFKLLTGEDSIRGEKKFQNEFFFDNYAKLIFATNQIPYSEESSDAFYRRIILIDFPNQFLDEKADKFLLDKLSTPEELSGFLNFGLEGLKHLLANGDFSYNKTLKEVQELYVRLSDSVAAFVIEMLEPSTESYLVKTKLYSLYCDYCRKNKYPIRPENTFHKDIQKQILIETYRPKEDDYRPYCWKGVKLKSLTSQTTQT